MQKIVSRDSSLDLLRILSILAVIAIHAVAPMVVTLPVSSTHWAIANVIDSSIRWCVPVFVMISGALLIRPDSFNERRKFLRKRIPRMLVAIAVWPIIYILWGWMETKAPIDGHAYIYSMLAGSPAPGHLYFLFLITGLYFITPLINLYVGKVKKKELNTVAIALLLVTTMWHLIVSFLPGQQGAQTLNFITQSIPYIGYFIAGFALKDFRPRYPQFYLFGYLFTVALLGLTTAYISLRYGIMTGISFYSYPSLLVIPMSICVFIFVREYYNRLQINNGAFPSILAMLSNATFGVYLMHMIVLSGLVKYLNLSQQSLKASACAYILTIVVTYSVSFALLRSRALRILIS